MIKIAVLTSTRAEYGLMRQLIFRLRDDADFDLNLLVTGTHLSEKFGLTVNEINDDHVPIAAKIDILAEVGEKIDVSKTMAKAISSFSDFFSNHHFDLLIVDGDRYETLAVCISAVNHHIPIAHCGGGETTVGASDEFWRHAITKLSYLHFPIMEVYRKRIICMGESPDRVCMSGALGLDNIRVMTLGTKKELEDRLCFSLDKPYAVVTFHPVTLEDNTFDRQADELLAACDQLTDMNFIFTKANADFGGDVINRKLEHYVKSHNDSAVCVPSLGTYYYFTAVKNCAFVMGNSSSGITEVPSFHIPTINIGDRQKGRERAVSIIDCRPISDDIIAAVNKARTEEFRKICKSAVNPNGDGHAVSRIIAKIKEEFQSEKISMEKSFYDCKGKDL